MSSEAAVISLSSVEKTYMVFDKPSHRLLQMLSGSRIKLYSEFQALRGVNLEVSKGETVGIVGRNGSGKSTLLSIICGTSAASSGSVRVEGKVAALLELGAGLNPELTGRENIELSAQIYGLSASNENDRHRQIIDFADIDDFIDRPVKTYSSGMFTRLAFSIVAHVDADILVIDEALAVGDAYFVQKCMRYLDTFRESGGTLLFVSHDMGAVSALCDRAVWLQDGRVLEDGSPKVVAESYLADLYRDRQGGISSMETSLTSLRPGDDRDYADARADLITNSNLRNDLEVFPFSPPRGFGSGGGCIVDVRLESEKGRILRWVVGGEMVRLVIHWQCDITVSALIIGFVVKNDKGQPLFGDNTYLTYMDSPVRAEVGDQGNTLFEFRMPVIPVGAYTMDVALSEGSQKEHVVMQWLHDALVFESHSSSVATGLLGIPMRRIASGVDNTKV